MIYGTQLVTHTNMSTFEGALNAAIHSYQASPGITVEVQFSTSPSAAGAGARFSALVIARKDLA